MLIRSILLAFVRYSNFLSCQLSRQVVDLRNILFFFAQFYLVFHVCVNVLRNQTLNKSEVPFYSGDKFCINILDLFGFECFSVNRFDQLIINTMNEQLQCYYNQRVFAWEMVRNCQSNFNYCKKLHST